MGHLDPPKGAVARMMYFDEFSYRYRLKAPYAISLWVIGAGLAISWIVAVW